MTLICSETIVTEVGGIDFVPSPWRERRPQLSLGAQSFKVEKPNRIIWNKYTIKAFLSERIHRTQRPLACPQQRFHGATENARLELLAPSKMQGWKMQDWKYRHQTAGVENAGPSSYGKPELCIHFGIIYASRSWCSFENLWWVRWVWGDDNSSSPRVSVMAGL